MEKLEIDKQTLLETYDKASSKEKKMLENLYGEKTFELEGYLNIRTFEDACEKLGINPKKVIPDFSFYPKKDQKAMISHAKLVIIAKALNEGWTPDWDKNEYKYYPWFKMSSSGFRLSDIGRWTPISDVGSRLCFKTLELALYAGKQFEDLYKDYFLI